MARPTLATLAKFAHGQADRLVVAIIRRFPNLQDRRLALDRLTDLLLSHVYMSTAEHCGLPEADGVLTTILANLGAHVESRGLQPPRILVARSDTPILPNLDTPPAAEKPKKRRRRKGRP